ncbi:MAG: FmdB family zinc ribbon protein [Coriobacteriia bacterium]
MPLPKSSDWCESAVPTYDLTCKECGNTFELFLTRLIRGTDKVCPVCGSVQVTTGVGGGFVKTSSVRTSCAPSGGFG